MSETSEPIKLKGKVNALNRYRKFLEISSAIMKQPFTKLEIKLLDELYHAGGILTTETRRQIRDNMKISPENLNNYIRVLRKKKILIDDSINPLFIIKIPESETMIINIELTVVI